jgi:transposase
VHSDSNALWAGIDVAKEWVDIAVVEQGRIVEQWRCARSTVELQQAAERLQRRKVVGAVLESSGGLEIAVGTALLAGGVMAFRINAKRVRDFARAHGVLAKTDRVDARVLALFGERMQPPARDWLDQDRQQLADWITRQRQLIDMRTMERNRLHCTTASPLRRSIERMLRWLEKELERIESELQAWWREHGARWNEQETRLRSMPGVGPKTARVLIAHLPELGRANRREIASLAGLAPIACESGAWRGRRRIRGGRAVVRSALYLASWTAVRLDATFRAFYENLVARGKARQLALIAVARRMLVALNDMLKNSRNWEKCTISA